MGKNLKGHSLFGRISEEIPSQQNPRYKLTHKKTWLDLVNKGIWPCDPQYLYRKMEEITSLDEYQPRGERLLFLRARDKFTLMPSRKPMRPEEALERLIVCANLDTMYGQMPIGGGKESVDIVKLEDRAGTFIELKPWRSSNSPLYALLESLKNLSLYRILQAKAHRGCNTIQKVRLAILAPVSYYQDYNFLDQDREFCIKINIHEYLKAVAKHFRVSIKFFALDWTEEDLWEICSRICPSPIEKKEIVSVAEYPPIEALKEKYWIELGSSA